MGQRLWRVGKLSGDPGLLISAMRRQLAQVEQHIMLQQQLRRRLVAQSASEPTATGPVIDGPRCLASLG